MMKHRDVIGENSMITMRKYFFTKNKKRNGRYPHRKMISTKTG
jgi:hypothetical protein